MIASPDPTAPEDASPVPGLTCRPGFVGTADEARILDEIDRQPWLTDLKRRVQHYGYRYDYRARTVGPDAAPGPLPDWLRPLALAVSGPGLLDAVPDQVIVNEYRPGQGISAHVDCVPCFGPRIATLSLGAACVMRFRHPGTGACVERVLEPGSLLVLAGPARTEWRHEIPARKSDMVDGVRRPRGRRVSVTFRTIVRAPPATPT